jgi:tetratricopeptide (TPR) repeat protein
VRPSLKPTVDESEETELEAAIAQIGQWGQGAQDGKVISACTDVLNRFPEAFELYYFRAQARAARRDRDGAIEDLGQAMRRNPKEPALFYFRGLWRLDAGEHSDAASDFQEAIALEEEMQSSYNVESARMARAVALMLLGRFSESELECSKIRPGAKSYLLGRMSRGGARRRARVRIRGRAYTFTRRKTNQRSSG